MSTFILIEITFFPQKTPRGLVDCEGALVPPETQYLWRGEGETQLINDSAQRKVEVVEGPHGEVNPFKWWENVNVTGIEGRCRLTFGGREGELGGDK